MVINFHTDSLESRIVECVNRGNDADTTGAIAGMLAGALYGAEQLPAHWLKALDAGVAARVADQARALIES